MHFAKFSLWSFILGLLAGGLLTSGIAVLMITIVNDNFWGEVASAFFSLLITIGISIFTPWLEKIKQILFPTSAKLEKNPDIVYQKTEETSTTMMITDGRRIVEEKKTTTSYGDPDSDISGRLHAGQRSN